jgi:hypothetical protein
MKTIFLLVSKKKAKKREGTHIPSGELKTTMKAARQLALLLAVVVAMTMLVACEGEQTLGRGAVGKPELVPGSVAPAFSLPTLDGGRLDFDPKAKRDGPLLFYAYNSQDAFSNAMWTTDAYLDDFILNATHTRYTACVTTTATGPRCGIPDHVRVCMCWCCTASTCSCRTQRTCPRWRSWRCARV